MGRALARGKVTPGSMLDMAIRLSGTIAKEGDGGSAGPSTGTPTTGADVYTPNPGSGKKGSRKSRLMYDSNND